MNADMELIEQRISIAMHQLLDMAVIVVGQDGLHRCLGKAICWTLQDRDDTSDEAVMEITDGAAAAAISRIKEESVDE